MTTANTSTQLPVTFTKQGGNTCEGIAIGRKGSALLISYKITNGDARERWLPGKRIQELHGDIDTLPRYKTKTCKAYSFEARLRLTWDEEQAMPACSKCGKRHSFKHESRTRKVTAEELTAYAEKGLEQYALWLANGVREGAMLTVQEWIDSQPELGDRTRCSWMSLNQKDGDLYVTETWAIGFSSLSLGDALA